MPWRFMTVKSKLIRGVTKFRDHAKSCNRIRISSDFRRTFTKLKFKSTKFWPRNQSLGNSSPSLRTNSDHGYVAGVTAILSLPAKARFERHQIGSLNDSAIDIFVANLHPCQVSISIAITFGVATERLPRATMSILSSW